MTLARACRDHEHVAADYTDSHGNQTHRRVEPYRLVTTGRRWYLMAFDLDRDDWRTLRLDRMTAVVARGTTFRPREAPDAAEYVGQAISASPYRYVARVRYHAAQAVVAQRFPPGSATVEADGPEHCIVTAGGDDPEHMVVYLATVGHEFDVLGPPEVIAAVRMLAGRMLRAAPCRADT